MRAGNPVYLSGQIPLDPATGELITGDITAQTRRVFENLTAVCAAAGGSLERLVRVGIYLTDLKNFAAVNAVMAEFCKEPYPARSTIGVSALPLGAEVEIDAVLVLD
jgi:reactive intermediate/imine deaminase